MQVGNTISVLGDATLGLNAMYHVASSATIVAATDKALQLKAYTSKGKPVTAWFPKKAFVTVKQTDNHFTTKFANWFTPTGWNDQFLQIANNSGCLSVPQ